MQINHDFPSPNFEARPAEASVDILLLHYTGMKTGHEALERLCDPAAKVSAHYLVEEDGQVFQLVAEEQRAWHAGVACWAGESDINSRSIGIEIVNPGHEWGYRPFPAVQMEAVAKLCRDILSRHPIPPARVLAHSDVAPTRKEDPGELFDWAWLAAQGIGLWPRQGLNLSENGDVNTATFLQKLARFGYPLDPSAPESPETIAAICAFQRHFRPADLSGQIDAQCATILDDLLAQRDSVA